MKCLFLAALSGLLAVTFGNKVEITDNVPQHGIGQVVFASPHRLFGRPSYRFTQRDPGICFDDSITKAATNIMSSNCAHCFTFSTLVRLEQKQVYGPLISVSSPSGASFEIRFYKSIKFRLTYTSNGQRTQYQFTHGLDLRKWEHLALVVCPLSATVNVYVDCLHVFKTQLPKKMDCFTPTAKSETLCIGGGTFLGSLQNTTFYVGGSDITRMCPESSASVSNQEYQAMQVRLSRMETTLRSELAACRADLSQLQCFEDGVRYMNGSRVSLPCRNCSCLNGNLICETKSCPPLPPCVNGDAQVVAANLSEGKCCATQQCVLRKPGCSSGGKLYGVGVMYRDNSKKCNPCYCYENGSILCPTREPCPPLSCPASQRVQGSGPTDCCPRCRKASDPCFNYDCGSGRCVTQGSQPSCQCYPGATFNRNAIGGGKCIFANPLVNPFGR